MPGTQFAGLWVAPRWRRGEGVASIGRWSPPACAALAAGVVYPHSDRTDMSRPISSAAEGWSR